MSEEYRLVGSYTDPNTGEEVLIDPLPSYNPYFLALTNGDGPLTLFMQRLAEEAITAEDARQELAKARGAINVFLQVGAPARRGRPPVRAAEPTDRPPAALTEREEAAVSLFHEHGRNKTAAAKAAGIKRQPFSRLLGKALDKLDAIYTFVRHRQVQALPTDERGQPDVG